MTISTGETIADKIVAIFTAKDNGPDILAEYTNKISQYFFNNEKFRIVAKPDGTDVIKITIGNEESKFIYDLGDGIQQVLILTFEAFFTKQDTLFFIEEPEIHLHPGLLRQLMSFYLNETEHYYFFTTHSNHLLDIANETDEAVIHRFIKNHSDDKNNKQKFSVRRCEQDRDLLKLLGVKPSSAYLTNCTIWVEGITDRLYIIKYMEKYLDNL